MTNGMTFESVTTEGLWNISQSCNFLKQWHLKFWTKIWNSLWMNEQKIRKKYRVWAASGAWICTSIMRSKFKSNQIKSLLLSHHHSTSALVSEILMSVLQTVQKNNRQFTYGQTVQKNNRQFTYGQTVQKTALEHLQCSRQCKKTTTAIYIWTDSAKKQQQFTYGQYIFTDCTEDNVQNTHTYTQYT